MKKAVVYIPVVLSLVVLGAHFMRFGNYVGVVGALLLIGLLLVRRPWVARLVQVILLLGTLEWLRTIYALAAVRAAHGQPFGRMVVILGVVAAVTLLSALLFQSATLKKMYGVHRQE